MLLTRHLVYQVRAVVAVTTATLVLLAFCRGEVSGSTALRSRRGRAR